METITKTVRESQTEMVEEVLPNDANPMGNILGGRVMHLIDLCGAITAMRHARRHVVTASMERLDFKHPIKVGEIIILKASVNYVGGTSMEVGVKVMSENPLTGKQCHTSSAYLTYVALDEKGRPASVPRLAPETDEEWQRYREAEKRRKARG